MKLRIAVFGGLLLAAAQAMACYTVFDGNSRILYQGQQAPVDMELQLHEALAQRFPRGAQLVFDETATCTPIGVAQVPRPLGGDVPPNTIQFQRGTGLAPASSSAPAPLLTDRATAERAHLPHTQVAGDIVMVPPATAERAMHAGVMVLPSSTFVAGSTPDTTVLGAGPAPRANARPVVATTRAPRKPSVVITELHNPPMTIIEGGGGVTIQR
jgi:hypothetical protein